MGKRIVDSLSAALLANVCKYLNCRAIGVEWIISAASLKAKEAFFSPSAAMI
jgi:hypothetical protein